MSSLKLLTLIAASTFAAFAGAAPQPVDDPAIRVQGVPLGRYRLSVDQFAADFRGKYALADGQILTVTNQHKHFYAQLGKRARVEIIPVAHHAFVARGADLTLLFDEFRDGQLNDVVLESRSFGLARALERKHRADVAYR